MPYEVREEGGRYCVYKKSGEKKKCYDSEAEAQDYLKALYAAEDDDMDDDKSVHESALGDGDADAVVVDDAPPPAPPPEGDDEDTQPLVPTPARKNIVQRIIDRLLPQNTAFKVAGNHFLITWSNNFKDRDGQLFTEKAIDAYVRRVDVGMTPPPELWVWHSGKNVRIGQASLIGRHGHFVIAAGEFDATPQAQRAKAYYTKHQRETGVSHGFTFAPADFDGKHYHAFNTFEISLLPKSVAANPFTNLEQVKESLTMALSENKRKYLRDVFGEEADRVLETLEESGKALEEMKAAYKDFADPDAGTTTDVSEQAVKEVSTDLKELIPDLIEGQAEVFRIEAATLKALKEHQDQMTAILARVEAAEKEAQAAREEVEAIKNDLPRRPSTDAETVVADKEIPDAMKNSMKTIDPIATKVLGLPVYKTP